MAGATVIPRMVIGFAETITHEVEIEETPEWHGEDAAKMADECREVREKLDALRIGLEKSLANGIVANTFIDAYEPTVPRLEKLVERGNRAGARLQNLQITSALDRDYVEEFGAMTKAAERYLALVRKTLAVMRPADRPIDWEEVRKAQAAHGRRESRPLRMSGPDGE